MPLREPRMELDKEEINNLLGWSPTRSIATICSLVRNLPENSGLIVNDVYLYNRGEVVLEDTERRKRKCFMISIWSKNIKDVESECLFQQPVPVKLRFTD